MSVPTAIPEPTPACGVAPQVFDTPFHHTPKHANWLNMVEIEIGVLRGQCLDRRIAERERLVSEIKAWQQQRNTSGAPIDWKFTTQKARDKLTRAYPDTANKS
jgi:hypothetical protein